jgi:hypothetical protein
MSWSIHNVCWSETLLCTCHLAGAQDKIAAPFGHQGGMQEGEDAEDPPVLSEHSCPICLVSRNILAGLVYRDVQEMRAFCKRIIFTASKVWR